MLDMKVTNRSPYNLRNRLAPAEKRATLSCPENELEPENRSSTSPVLESFGAAETCVKNIWTVEDVCKLNLPVDETSMDAEEVHSSCLMPVVTSADNENEEVSLVCKVRKANLSCSLSK